MISSKTSHTGVNCIFLGYRLMATSTQLNALVTFHFNEEPLSLNCAQIFSAVRFVELNKRG